MTSIAALLVMVVAVGACAVEIPEESVALARLAEAETLAAELVEKAVEPGHITPWERSLNVEGCPRLCRGGNCHESASRMFLEGVFDLDEVMEAFAQAAEAAGGTVRDVEQIGGVTRFPDGATTLVVFGYFRFVFLTGPGGSRHGVLILWEDGAVKVMVDTGEPGCYRVQE